MPKTNKEYIVKDTFVAHECCPECGNKVLNVVQMNRYDTNKVVEHIACTDCNYIFEPGIVVGDIQHKDIRVIKAKAEAFDTLMNDEVIINYIHNWLVKGTPSYNKIQKGIDAFNKGRVDD